MITVFALCRTPATMWGYALLSSCTKACSVCDFPLSTWASSPWQPTTHWRSDEHNSNSSSTATYRKGGNISNKTPMLEVILFSSFLLLFKVEICSAWQKLVTQNWFSKKDSLCPFWMFCCDFPAASESWNGSRKNLCECTLLVSRLACLPVLSYGLNIRFLNTVAGYFKTKKI